MGSASNEQDIPMEEKKTKKNKHLFAFQQFGQNLHVDLQV